MKYAIQTKANGEWINRIQADNDEAVLQQAQRFSETQTTRILSENEVVWPLDHNITSVVDKITACLKTNYEIATIVSSDEVKDWVDLHGTCVQTDIIDNFGEDVRDSSRCF